MEPSVEICKKCFYLNTEGCGFNPGLSTTSPACNYRGTVIGMLTRGNIEEFLTWQQMAKQAANPIEDPYFRQDYLGSYIYDPETNEVQMIFHKTNPRLEASVLIETLADFIIDISQVQSSGGRQE